MRVSQEGKTQDCGGWKDTEERVGAQCRLGTTAWAQKSGQGWAAGYELWIASDQAMETRLATTVS